MSREPIFAPGALPTLLMFGAVAAIVALPWVEIGTGAAILAFAFPGIALLLAVLAGLLLLRLYFGPAPSEPDVEPTAQQALWCGILIGVAFALLMLR